MTTLLNAVLLITACLVAGGAHATDDWSLTGFGTLGLVRPTDEKLSLLRNGINTPGRDGMDFGADSVLGVQAGRSFDGEFDLTAQVVVREDQTGHVEPRIAWAFVRFSPAADLDIRIGRLRAPFFMYSESLWINYANPWVRLPTEVYGLNPFSDLDGADLAWQAHHAGLELEIRPFFGKSSLERQIRRARLKRIFGLNLLVLRDEFTLHLGHAESPFSLPWGDPVFLAVDNALRRSSLGAVAEQLSGNDGYARFDSIGLQWDQDIYLASVEFAKRSANRYIPSAHGWQATLGRRQGPVTVYGTLARQTLDAPVDDSDLSTSPQLQGALDLFNGTRNTAQRSLTVGIRWDVHRNAALKLEFNHAKIASESLGSYFAVEDSGLLLLSGRRVNLLSASLDFSF